jgi:butyryl-CoA dehydrogenase
LLPKQIVLEGNSNLLELCFYTIKFSLYRFPAEQIAKLGDLGLLGVCATHEYGGSGLDTTSLSIAVEEVSRGCGGTGTICSVHNSLFVNLVQRKGNAAQKEEFLKPYTKGTLGVFALSESEAGSDVGAMATEAKKDGEHWILNGTKAWVTSGNISSEFFSKIKIRYICFVFY